MSKAKITATLYAILAAIFYAVNIPMAKILLNHIAPTMMASFLYFGAGIGIGIIYLFGNNKLKDSVTLSKRDLPYTLGMIGLDTLAPICLMFGLSSTTAANASLLNNFEIAATSIIALVIFKEMISKRLWAAILLITVSSMLLSFEDMASLQFSWGSAFVLLAALCWGFENNYTRKISSKSTYEIVMLKGLFSGLGSFIIAILVGEKLPAVKFLLIALMLGFVAYGLSIFFYIKAQRELGAAKTSAYYAIAPFVGAFLSFVFLKEPLTARYAVSLFLMMIGSFVVAFDTMILNHSHMHTHTIVHTHGGTTHSHVIEHAHAHNHITNSARHRHTHSTKSIAHL
ncbi:putative membrane protein [uncultured Eubacteriales bacterium]|uniref:Putative membrane protein n=1 Tax=uncultured Eubacteriales bacterium TaxID=172733 RepID=A0A212IZQ7_9FIRM|nr:putative membrane protein [uncultured Eubacteriales bacterium]